MKLETGTPTISGRYVVYVKGIFGSLVPAIILWQNDRWQFQYSFKEYPDEVFYWIGPLPVVSKPKAVGERTNCGMCGCDIPVKGDTPDDHAPGCPESGPPKDYDL